MARLPRDETKIREEFMKSLFTKTPDLSQPKANTAFAEKFGSKMRPQRVYEIRQIVQDELKLANTKTPETAGRNPGKKTMSNKKPVKKPILKKAAAGNVVARREGTAPEAIVSEAKLVRVDVGTENAVANAVKNMKKAGIAIDVDFVGAGYVIVRA